MNLESISFQIISNSGQAKSLCMEAITLSKTNYLQAKDKIIEATNYLLVAKNHHMELATFEAQGNDVKINLLLVHAEDQMLNSETIILLAKELIELNHKVTTFSKEQFYKISDNEITKIISD